MTATSRGAESQHQWSSHSGTPRRRRFLNLVRPAEKHKAGASDDVSAANLSFCIKLATNEFSKAITILESAIEIDYTPWIRAILGYALAGSGHSDDARRTIEQLIAISSQRYISPLHIAVILIGLNEKEEAFLWLEKAYEERADLLVALQVDPVYAPFTIGPSVS